MTILQFLLIVVDKKYALYSWLLNRYITDDQFKLNIFRLNSVCRSTVEFVFPTVRFYGQNFFGKSYFQLLLRLIGDPWRVPKMYIKKYFPSGFLRFWPIVLFFRVLWCKSVVFMQFSLIFYENWFKVIENRTKRSFSYTAHHYGPKPRFFGQNFFCSKLYKFCRKWLKSTNNAIFYDIYLEKWVINFQQKVQY